MIKKITEVLVFFLLIVGVIWSVREIIKKEEQKQVERNHIAYTLDSVKTELGFKLYKQEQQTALHKAKVDSLMALRRPNSILVPKYKNKYNEKRNSIIRLDDDSQFRLFASWLPKENGY